MASEDFTKRTRLLVVGSFPPPIGGTTVALRWLVGALREASVCEVVTVDTGRLRGKGVLAPLALFGLMCRIARAIRRSDVVTLHLSNPATLGLPVLLLARVFGKPLAIRKFGGSDYRTLQHPWQDQLSDAILRRVDLYLVETRHLVQQAEHRGIPHVRWFPNSRGPTPIPDDGRSAEKEHSACKRFVYFGHVRECKGIRILADAAKQLTGDIIIDVYGPWFDDLERDLLDDNPRIHYRGTVPPEEALTTMRQYDALVFPTHHEGEGYAGAVIEAYGAGLPVVATRWQALPEIVDDTVGILVPPRDATALSQAMARLNEDIELFHRLRFNTRRKAAFFAIDRWAQEFIMMCQELINKKTARRNEGAA